jgi:hypothetical protein
LSEKPINDMGVWLEDKNTTLPAMLKLLGCMLRQKQTELVSALEAGMEDAKRDSKENRWFSVERYELDYKNSARALREMAACGGHPRG